MLITVAAHELCSSCLLMPLPPPPFAPTRSDGRDEVTMNVVCSVQVLTMMLEADIDGNNGIDFGEFKDVIFRVLDEEG